MHIQKTPFGTYRVRWRTADGRERSRTYKTKALAEKGRRKIIAALEAGEDPTPPKMTVRSAVDTWLENAANLSKGAQETYRRDVDAHILPVLGDRVLTGVTPDDIDKVLRTLEARGLASSTVHRSYRTMNRLFNVAQKRGWVSRNPCAAVDPPKVEHREMRFLTAEEIHRLAESIGPRYRAWVYVSAFGGLRWSESVGLRRSAVDLDGDTPVISVREQLLKREDGWERQAPKQSSSRQVTLPGFVATELETHFENFTRKGPDSLVFTNAAWNPMEGPSFRFNHWAPACAKAGLATVTKDGKIRNAPRIHDLRHTCVALLIAQGVHPKLIQSQLGHSSIKVTLDRYGHLYPDANKAVAAALDVYARPDNDLDA